MAVCNICGKVLKGSAWYREYYDENNDWHTEYFCNRCALENYIDPYSNECIRNGLLSTYIRGGENEKANS